MFWHCVSDTACQFGRLRPLTQNRRFAIIPTVRGDGSRYPIGDIGHHSALFDETLRRSWREPPPYMAKLSALLDTTLRLTCIKVRRRVVESTAESCLMYGGALERRGRRVVQTSIYRSHDLPRVGTRPPWHFGRLARPTGATDIADLVDRVYSPSGNPSVTKRHVVSGGRGH